ncbi:unnamed protein product [Rangifer tarandus platyrhynchus]|uniref:Uncharacterized protein n=1 Tax=Rangifer tarandus platyrhynchus TaxID=3082113 RepID=A0ABN8ZVP7_RANTA|nr:unnamed protein product [Rangifer tarandus platyrhynchus]
MLSRGLPCWAHSPNLLHGHSAPPQPSPSASCRSFFGSPHGPTFILVPFPPPHLARLGDGQAIQSAVRPGHLELGDPLLDLGKEQETTRKPAGGGAVEPGHQDAQAEN